MASLRVVLVAVLVALAGCASDPPVQISERTWRQVDSDIATVSRAASAQARANSLAAMQRWRELVYRRTDTAFIPWFSSYWTQQWLGLKVSWYKLGSGGEKDQTVSRLALYLQEQYQEQVLEPVAEDIDPERILLHATEHYVRQLGQHLPTIALRHGVPAEQFDRHLKTIPAIGLAPGASLYQVVHAESLERLPAYGALIERIRRTPGGAGDWSTNPGISAVAQRTSERLVNDMATSGAASAVSSMVGRVAGAAISLGVAAFSAMARVSDRPDAEAQLRHNLGAAFDEEWLELVHDPGRGVMAGVHHLSGHIERDAAGAALTAPGVSLRGPLPRQEQPAGWRE